jgi:hypothetical protein
MDLKNPMPMLLFYYQGDADDPAAGVISVTDARHNRVDLLTGIRGMPEDVFNKSSNG